MANLTKIRFREMKRYMFEDAKIGKTVDARNMWGDKIDKRMVKVTCPHCGHRCSPLCTVNTMELDTIKIRFRHAICKEMFVIYGVICSKCGKKFIFKVYIRKWHYAKLGEY